MKRKIMFSAWEWHAFSLSLSLSLSPEVNEKTCHVFSTSGQLTSMMKPRMSSEHRDRKNLDP